MSQARVDEVTDFNWDHVCTLSPYQDRLEKNEIFSELVNEKLDRLGFKSDEGHWVFAFIRGQETLVAIIKRGDDLDFMGVGPSLKDFVDEKFMQGVQPMTCVSRSEAIFSRFKFKSRNYLVLGRKVS